MKTRFAFLALMALALGACKSSSQDDVDVDLSSVPCICGRPEAAFEGCPYPACVSGEGNPDNPDCVCGPLEIGGEN